MVLETSLTVGDDDEGAQGEDATGFGCGCFGARARARTRARTRARDENQAHQDETRANERASRGEWIDVSDRGERHATVEATVEDERASASEDGDESKTTRDERATLIDVSEEMRRDVEKELSERRDALASEEAAVRERERAVRARDEAVSERERLVASASEDVERRLMTLHIEEKRLMSATRGRNSSSASATYAANATNATNAEGDLSDVGEVALEAELRRVRKTTKQFSEKERAMLEQINALRRARDASEARVRQLADELDDVQKDHAMWSREEKAAERRFAEDSPTTSTVDRELPDWLRSPEPALRATADSSPPTYKKFSPSKLIIPESATTPPTTPTTTPTTTGAAAQHPIFSAIRNGRVSEVQDILVRDIDRFDVETRDSFGNTVLIVAAQNNRKRVTKMCVKAGVQLDARNKQGNTALHYCYGYGYFELGEYLINKGADANATNAAGETAFDGLSPEQKRSLRQTRETLARAKRAKKPGDSSNLSDDRPESYSDVESVVAFTDDDDDDAFVR